MQGKEDMHKELEAILGEFRAPIRYAFAYGSGVFKQKGYSDKVGRVGEIS